MLSYHVTAPETTVPIHLDILHLALTLQQLTFPHFPTPDPWPPSAYSPCMSPSDAPIDVVLDVQLTVQTTQAYRCSAADYERMIEVQNELNSQYSSEIITEYAFNGAGILQEVNMSKWYIWYDMDKFRILSPSLPNPASVRET